MSLLLAFTCQCLASPHSLPPILPDVCQKASATFPSLPGDPAFSLAPPSLTTIFTSTPLSRFVGPVLRIIVQTRLQLTLCLSFSSIAFFFTHLDLVAIMPPRDRRRVRMPRRSRKFGRRGHFDMAPTPEPDDLQRTIKLVTEQHILYVSHNNTDPWLCVLP